MVADRRGRAIAVVPTPVLAASIALAGCRDSAEQPSWVAQDLGSLGGPENRAVDVNERGQVVGSSETAGGDEHAFLWSHGSIRDLGTLGGRTSRAVGVNSLGEVVGSSETAAGKTHAFLWRRGRMLDLGSLDEQSEASWINDRGEAVGSSTGGQDCAACNPTRAHAFMWRRGRTIEIGPAGVVAYVDSLNERGQVAGTLLDHAGQAFLWQNGRLRRIDVGAGTVTYGADLNERGQVLVMGAERSFVWNGVRRTELGNLGGGRTVGESINDGGRVVGLSTTAEGDWHAFLWDRGGMRDLFSGSTLPELGLGVNPTQLSLTINNRDQVLAQLAKGSTVGNWVWERGSWSELEGLPDWPKVRAGWINNRGQIVGSTSAEGIIGSRAVLWTRRP